MLRMSDSNWEMLQLKYIPKPDRLKFNNISLRKSNNITPLKKNKIIMPH